MDYLDVDGREGPMETQQRCIMLQLLKLISLSEFEPATSGWRATIELNVLGSYISFAVQRRGNITVGTF
jgi:hypothetical protein